MLVSEIMSRSLITVQPADTVESTARLLSQHGVGALPVCTEEGQLRGMITDRDIALRCVAADLPAAGTLVSRVMTKGIVSVEAHSDIREAAWLMGSAKVRRLPVTKGGRVIGMLSLADLIKCSTCSTEIASAISEISRP